MLNRTHACPQCGVELPDANTQALCPACLMSAALRQDAETVVADQNERLDTAPRTANRENGSRATFDLPKELGDYTLTSLLGQGGMGTVYEAVQRPTGRRLALKLLGQNLDSVEMRQRFLREGRLAARVNHPASLYVFGSEEIDGIPAITMEIAAGGTLQDAIDRRGRLPVGEAVDAVLSMIDGLEAALERGVLHRDIKPSNCFVSPDGTVKVGDFGLSVSTLPSMDTFMTQTGKVMGTPAFASPEQLRGDQLDARSDLYSVGATLFTLLTARAPFTGDNAVQVVANVIDKPPADLALLRDELPQGLASVIERCLAKDPAGRYVNYAALRDALLPYSSVVPEPATQSQRTAAGWIDYLLAFMPAYVAIMVTIGPERLFIRPFYEFTFAAWGYHLLIIGAAFLYFGLTEGIWGAGVGKWIMSLRISKNNGGPPGVGRALLRIFIPIALIECVRIPLSLAVLPAGAWTGWDFLLFNALAVSCPWIVALLWLPARRSNGFATVWDMATGTRVVIRQRGTRRPMVDAAREPAHEQDTSRCVGPFRVTAEIESDQWLVATDPVLRRSVWLVRRASGTVSDARRTVARPGRARWLQEVVEEGVVWDAFEAARGMVLSERMVGEAVPWSTLRYWLHDVAAEFRAAERDGTLPTHTCMDCVFVTDDGRALLLEQPWPHQSPAAGDDSREMVDITDLPGQQKFLQTIAAHVDPLSVPLHAQRALRNLRSASFEKLTFLAGTLRGLLHKPAEVSRGLRAASLFVVPGYTWVATFLGIATNTDPSVGPAAWAARVAIAGLVMLHIIAFFDVALAFWGKSTGLTTFGLEVVTADGRASRSRMLRRAGILWLPVLVPSMVFAVSAWATGTWIDYQTAVTFASVVLAGAAVFSLSALAYPTRGLQDRLAGVWIGRN